MTRILVISDTHIPLAADELPKQIEAELKKCDICIHAGDSVDESVIKHLSSVTNVYAVSGNMDTAALKARLKDKLTVTIDGVNIGITHGRGHPDGVKDYVKELFNEQLDKLDIIIFGHTHKVLNEESHGVIYFNPGSATDQICSSCRTYGIIEVDGGKILKREIHNCE